MNYQIRRGDTLSSLAARFGTTTSALARANHLSNPNLIYAGESLRVPGHSTQDRFEGAGGSGRSAPVEEPRGVAGTAGATGSRRLAEAARRVALSMGGYSSQGLCATGVSRAIANSMGIRVWGNGNQIDNNLPRSRFREVRMSLEEALRTPGLVLTWERTSTRLGRIYGHTAITAGDGHTSYSDFVERNTTNAGRRGLRVFMPVA